ncbi:MAG: hypothetical protein HQK78_15140 [Desulfobacterales bacterium]|nr:hypothetical protein [Desulfobacterales bacterium]
MNYKKLLLISLILITSSYLSFAASSSKSLPKPGKWEVSTDFGTFNFTVNSKSDHVENVGFKLSKFKCGYVEITGGVSMKSKEFWPIKDSEFTSRLNLKVYKITINGKFDETGEQASGTWEIYSGGQVCKGEWESKI